MANENKFKIVVINSVYAPYARGGAEVVVENIVGGLVDREVGCLVVSVGRKRQVEQIDGVKVYRIKPFNLFNFLDIDSKSAWLRLPWHIIDMFNDVQTWRIFKVLEQEKPDLAMTHNLKGLGYYLPLLLKIMKIRHIHTVHDMQLLHPSGLLKTKPLPIYTWLCRKLFGSPAVVIFPSEYIKGVYEKYGFFRQSNRLVLGNPIVIASPARRDEAIFKNDKIASSLLAPRNDNNDKLNFLFLGQVEEYKGILDLITAFKSLKQDFALRVVGDGKALGQAKKLAESDSQITFYGRLSQAELEQKIWPEIDLLINPSRTPESFGMVVLEAFSQGIPVLASNIGALPELVIENQTGWLFEPGNIDDLAAKLNYITTSFCRTEAMRLHCQSVAKQYNLDNYLNQLLEFGKIGE